jgi:hypothetical protein
MRRQIAIASPGRTASTTLYNAVVIALRDKNLVYHIWDFSPVRLLEDAYRRKDIDAVVVKGETYHFIEHLKHRDVTDLILLTRRNKLAQVVSHLVSLRGGRFHAKDSAPMPRFRVSRDECLFVAHFIRMSEAYFRTTDFRDFRRVERWLHEDLVADLPGHLARLDLATPGPVEAMRGIPYELDTVENLEELKQWCREAGLSLA